MDESFYDLGIKQGSSPGSRRTERIRALHRYGITNPDGSIDRPVGSGTWGVPSEIRVEGENLTWRSRGGPAKNVTVGPGMLEDFLKLDTAGEQVIVRYANKWGVLGLCGKHGFPSTHVPHRLRSLFEDDCWPCRVPEWGGRQGEPIGRWRHYAGQGNAILAVGAALGGAIPSDGPKAAPWEMWQVMTDLFVPLFDIVAFERLVNDRHDRLKVQGRLLEMAVEKWLALGDVRIGWRWADGSPQVDLGGDSLFSALALQLTLALARLDGLSICDECGRSYLARRRAPAGKPRYCPECRGTVPARNWYRRQQGRTEGEDDG